MSLKWTLEQVDATLQKPVSNASMRRMLEANRADAWMLRLALERSAENEDLDPGGDRERRGYRDK